MSEAPERSPGAPEDEDATLAGPDASDAKPDDVLIKALIVRDSPPGSS